MSTEENKALFRRFMQRVANQGDLSVIHQMMPPDYCSCSRLVLSHQSRHAPCENALGGVEWNSN